MTRHNSDIAVLVCEKFNAENKTQLKPNDAVKLVALVFETIGECISEGDRVVIRGFAAFKPKTIAPYAHSGFRNANTVVSNKPTYTIGMRCSDTLKTYLRDKAENAGKGKKKAKAKVK